MMKHTLLLGLLLLAVPAAAQDRKTKVLSDRDKFAAGDFWIYNDLTKGFAEAARSGKPLLVVFRCIPCEACVQIDSEVADRDPAIRGLMEKFVCVRIVHANGMDLSLFQFDYDQSWAAFMLNADRTIYGRYGTRSHQTKEEDDISLEGFGKALEGALELHRDFAKHKKALAAKTGPPSAVRVPEEFPAMKGKFSAKLDYEGQVVKSCIHCHQVGESLRLQARPAIPDTVMFPYPHPKSLGLILDPKECATVKSVTPGSDAEKAGFKPGDRIATLEGQPILSIADLQWVLHHAPDAATLRAGLQRGGKDAEATLKLAAGWRRRGDISWRATSWDLRRMFSGGLLLKDDVTEDRRRELGLAAGTLALRVEHVGEYGEHAAAKKAGFLKNDVLVEVGGKSAAMSESQWLRHLSESAKPGQQIPVTVLRGKERMALKLPIQ